jgi:hypothetical protein
MALTHVPTLLNRDDAADRRHPALPRVPIPPTAVRPTNRSIQRMVDEAEMLPTPIYEHKTNKARIAVAHDGDRKEGVFKYVGPEGYSGLVTYKLASIYKKEVTMFAMSGTTLEAFAFSTLDAKPNGLALGNILLFHLAEFAMKSNIPYVCAKGAVPAAMTFYQRLGFFFGRSDNSTLEKYGWGDNVGKDIQNVVVGSLKEKYKDLFQKDAKINQKRLESFSSEQTTINDIISRGFLYISSNTLVTNTRAAWQQKWTKIK